MRSKMICPQKVLEICKTISKNTKKCIKMNEIYWKSFLLSDF